MSTEKHFLMHDVMNIRLQPQTRVLTVAVRSKHLGFVLNEPV